MKISTNIYNEILILYNIYLSRNNIDFSLSENFNHKSFFNFIYPQLQNIIDIINKQKEKSNEMLFNKSDNHMDINNDIIIPDIKNVTTNNDYHLSMYFNNSKNNPDNNSEKYIFNLNSNNYKSKKDVYFNEVIYPIFKKLFRKIVLICHPDKNPLYKDGILFSRVCESYDQKLLIGMINYSIILNINLDFINLDSDLIKYLISEMILLINKIINNA